MVKILHTADVHFCPENQGAVLESLNTFYNEGMQRQVDLFVLAGDLFDLAVHNTGASGLPAMIDVIAWMLDFAPVIAIQGTSTHDVFGCYKILQHIKAKHGFTLIEPGMAYLLVNGVVAEDYIWENKSISSCLILGCPEPDKAWLLANNTGLGRTEADQALKNGLQNLFLGFAAIRKQYPQIPCLFLYHGNVSGSMLQNGQLLQPGCISIGKDDLALIGADYYALGHIHLYQQLPGLPAYYAGSVSPVNWGETDQKAFNYAELIPGNVQVEKILYPHAPRKKIVWTYEPEAKILTDAVGFQAWVVRKATKEELAFFDTNQFLEKLCAGGLSLPGTRVTTEVIPVETVRAAEIQEVEHLQDKLRIYAECSGQELTDSIREKAILLEGEASKEGFHRNGAHIRLQRLILHGAIGFWKKQRKDEVIFDFEAYDPGLIAVIGENGMGKTTLIENCHPYLSMLTRDDTLQKHFRLRDSYRDLYFTDERTGIEYRALIQIDGKSKSGNVQAFLYKKIAGQFVPYNAEITGRQAAYEKAILELWGSKTLFLKSAFMAQKATPNNPDLTDSGKTGNKELFLELAGLEYYQKQSDLAKGKADQLDTDSQLLKIEIDLRSVEISSLPEKETRIRHLLPEIAQRTASLEQLKREGAQAKVTFNDLKNELELHNRKKQQISLLTGQNNELNTQLEKINADRITNEDAISHQAEAEKKIAEYNELHLHESEQIKERSRIDFDNQLLKEEYLKERESYQETMNDLNDQLTLTLRKKAELEALQTVAENNYTANEKEKQKLCTDKKCPTCGQVLPKDMRFIEKRQVALENEKNKYKAQVEYLVHKITEIQSEIDILLQKKQLLPIPQEQGYAMFDDSILRELQTKLNFFKIEKYRQILKKAETAEIILQQLKERETTISRQLEIFRQQIATLQDELSTDIEARYHQAGNKLEDLRTRYTEQQSWTTALSHEKQILEKEISSLQEIKEKLTALEKERAAKQTESAEWRWLQVACGRDGVQALELDALAPAITGIANNLLAITDDRYTVEIRTTRLAGKGSKVKQVEDFSIWIHDQSDDTYQELSTLSGGESVWMRKAIYDAFGIIRAKNTGLKFLTAFQDEADGALHPKAKHLYLRMVEQAHMESGRYQTLIITHSPDVQQSIRQKVDVGKLDAPAAHKEEVA